MRHATSLLYHVCAVASRNIRFASCATSGNVLCGRASYNFSLSKCVTVPTLQLSEVYWVCELRSSSGVTDNYNTMFELLGLFLSSVEWRHSPASVGSLGEAKLSHWTTVGVTSPSRKALNRFGYRNTVLSGYLQFRTVYKVQSEWPTPQHFIFYYYYLLFVSHICVG
jgi:hypothetical protein